MKKIIKILVPLVIAAFYLINCTYKKDQLPNSNGNNPLAGCDTTAVKYSTQIVPILTNKCYSCHAGNAAAGAGIKLDTYSSLLPWVNNGGFYGSVSHNPNYSPMPKNSNKLSDCNLAVIRTWIRNGAPNN